MPASFTIEIQVGDVTEVLTVMEAAFEDPSELMADVLLVMIRSTQLTFEASGRPERWDDLAESTERKRFRKAAGGALGPLGAIGAIEILRDTGLLFQSVGGGASGPFEAAAGFGESDDLAAIIGTSQPGWQNQFADTRGWRPARPFLLIQDDDERDIMEIAVAWMTRTGPYAA